MKQNRSIAPNTHIPHMRLFSLATFFLRSLAHREEGEGHAREGG
jgi:hypothetical protein